MPDNHQPIDKAFTDQAWLEMKALLDREMPVRPAPLFWFRKRFLWLLLLLVPFGAAWGYYQFRLHKAPAAPSTPDQPAAQPAEKPVAQVLAGEEDCDEQYTASVATAKQSVSPKPGKQVVSGHAGGWLPAPETQPSLPLVQAELFPAEKQAPPLIHALALLATNRFYASMPDPEFASIPLSPKEVHTTQKTRSPLQISLEAGPFAHAGFQSPGFAAGLRLGKNLGRSAWGLQSGLSYAYYASPFPGQSLRSNLRGDDVAELAGNFSDPFNQFDPEAYESINRLAASTDSVVSHLHFLEIPLTLTRQLGKRWQVSAGGGAGLLLAARTETGANAGQGLFSYASDNALEENDPGSGFGSSGSLAEMPQFYPYLEGGVTFNPLPRLGLSTQVHAGLRDMLPAWPGNQLLTGLKLKVSYSLR